MLTLQRRPDTDEMLRMVVALWNWIGVAGTLSVIDSDSSLADTSPALCEVGLIGVVFEVAISKLLVSSRDISLKLLNRLHRTLFTDLFARRPRVTFGDAPGGRQLLRSRLPRDFAVYSCTEEHYEHGDQHCDASQ